MKKIKLTLAERLNLWMGRAYLVNKGSKEIHRLRHKHVNCHLDLITDKKFVKNDDLAHLLLGEKYNGCRWCYQEWDKG